MAVNGGMKWQYCITAIHFANLHAVFWLEEVASGP